MKYEYEKLIKSSAKKFVAQRRTYSNALGNARKAFKYPMMLFFLGDDLEECMLETEDTLADVWANINDAAFCCISEKILENDEELKSCVLDAVDEGIKSMDVYSVQIYIVARVGKGVTDYIKKIKDFIDESVRLTIGKNNLVYTVFSVYNSSIVRADEIIMFDEHLKSLEKVEDFKQNRFRSILVPQKEKQVNSVCETIATSIIYLNSPTGIENVTTTSVFPLGTHIMLGYSQADVPLNTIYIVGFDALSDMIIDTLENKKYNIAVDDSFDVETKLLADYVKKSDQLKQRLENGKQYIANNVSFTDYIELNYKKSNIEKPSEDDIREKFESLLWELYKKNGLEYASAYLESISKEALKNNSNSIDLGERNNKSSVSAVLDAKKEELKYIAYKCIIDYAKDENNIIKRMRKIFDEVTVITERCKQETAVLDKDVQISDYEKRIQNEKESITLSLKNEEFEINYSDTESFLDSIIAYYEDKIANQLLFSKLTSFMDIVESMNNTDANNWIDSQIKGASVGKGTISNANTQKLIVTNLDFDVQDNFKSFNSALKNFGVPVLNVTGTPMFRVLDILSINYEEKGNLWILRNLYSEEQ